MAADRAAVSVTDAKLSGLARDCDVVWEMAWPAIMLDATVRTATAS
jgi:hypothetical protein